MQSANVKALDNSYKAQRKMTHEFRGYLFALSDMLANGDTEAAQTYLDELKVRQTERILLVNTHNPMWCGDLACEEAMKADAGLSSRCMPFAQEHLSDVCPVCGKPAQKMVVWGVAY